MLVETPARHPHAFADRLKVLGITALFCCLGYWYLIMGGGKISLLWPTAGVATALFVVLGDRMVPAIFAGHMVVWAFIFPEGVNWPILLVPYIYTLEAWSISRWGYGMRTSSKGSSASAPPVAWSFLGAPIVCAIPCTLVTLGMFTLSGRFAAGEMVTNFLLIITAHLHGVIAFTALGIHVLRKDFNWDDVKRGRAGVVAGMASLLVMALAFTGGFDGLLSPHSAIFLPFPLLVMAAVWLSPPPVSVLIAIWCVLSTALTSFGTGPFALGAEMPDELMNPAELGIYNIVMGSVAYLVSVGTWNFQRQLALNQVALEAAGIQLWEWSAGKGFSVLRSDGKTGGQMDRIMAAPGRDSLGALSGQISEDGEVADFWRTRIQEQAACATGEKGLLLESVGRVLQRGPDGHPRKAIGLLQDMSDLQAAEKAVAALVHQKAELRNLQAKLNPHFLFNSLNVIRALVHIDAKASHEAITSLAGLLRSSLRTTESDLISLGEELEQIHALLHLAKLRFGSRLESRVEVPAALAGTPVPPMLLLNLVENALTHGIGNCEGGGRIHLVARSVGGSVRISVMNTGHLSELAVAGYGTEDARQRLELLYQAKASFSLTQMDARTVLADVVVPTLKNPTHEPEITQYHPARC